MNVIYSPQRSEQKINYTFDNEIINVELNGKHYATYDFTGLPDGESEIDLETFTPLLAAKRENGVLTVKLLMYYTAEEKEKFEGVAANE